MVDVREIAIQDVLALAVGQVRAQDAQVAQALVAAHQLVQDALDAQAHAVGPALVRDAQVVQLLAQEPRKALGVLHAAMIAPVLAVLGVRILAKTPRNNLAIPAPTLAFNLVRIHAPNLAQVLAQTHATHHATELVLGCAMDNAHGIVREVVHPYAVLACKVAASIAMAIARFFAYRPVVAFVFPHVVGHVQD